MSFLPSRLLRATFSIGPILFGLGGCTATEAEDGASKSDLVGGNVAAEDDLPGVVAMLADGSMHCSGAKVGPRHLLVAAHCVVDLRAGADKVRAEYAHGAKFEVAYSRATIAKRVEVSIDEVFLHEQWVRNCAGKFACYGDQRAYDSPDLALIVTSADFPEVPSAVIDIEPVAEGDRVTVLGYGCEAADGQYQNPKPRLKSKETTIVSTETLYQDPLNGMSGFENMARKIDNWYAVTNSQAADANSAGVCPGDSGGPLLRAGTKTPTVVGVNARSFHGSNMHTRVDNRSGVGDFLQSHGAQVTHSRR